MNFLYDGEIHCEKDSLKIIENLRKIFGFPKNLDMNYPNESFSTSVNDIETMTITEEVFENIQDAQKIVMIPIRNKGVNGKLEASDQFKDDNVLHNGEKKVSKEKNKSKKISRKKTHPKKFKCNDCGALFIHKFNLQRHINAIHLKLKPYVCDQCKMSFSQKGFLQNHINSIHLKIKPYECEQCNKSFSREGCMKDHVKEVHQKLRPYRCRHCDHIFSRKRYLGIHVKRVHLNEKPSKEFVCNESRVQQLLSENMP